MKKLFFCFIFLFVAFKGYSQTYNWTAYPAGGTGYTNGNMSVAVTSSGSYFESGTPKYVARVAHLIFGRLQPAWTVTPA